MLRSFRVANHRSIREEQELLLMPAYAKTQQVVPVAGIFGANASGKSNFIDALAWMQSAVTGSFAWGSSSGIPRKPFKLMPGPNGSPTSFMIDIVLADVQYVYGFELDDRAVWEEWLHAYPLGRKRVIFERSSGEWIFGSTVPAAKFDSASELTRENVLFLTVAANSGLSEVDPVFRWFQRELMMVVPNAQIEIKRIAGFIQRSDEHKRTLVELLQAADLGIRGVDVVVFDDSTVDALVDRVKDKMPGARVLETPRLRELVQTALVDEQVAFKQGFAEVAMSLEEQSFGTRAWLKLLIPVLEALELGSVVIVDEIDSSLHAHLSARLIDLFQQPETNPHTAQLIFTTHDASLLSPTLGGDTLLRDQIWFTEKDAGGASKLFALSDFHPRQGENTARRYLGGAYGAIPVTSEYAFRRALSDFVGADAKA